MQCGAIGETDGRVFAIGCGLMEAEDGGMFWVCRGFLTAALSRGSKTRRGKREQEPSVNARLWIIGVVGDFAADVAVFFLLFDGLHIQRYRCFWMGKRAHYFLH